jgi:hypothetical protein
MTKYNYITLNSVDRKHFPIDLFSYLIDIQVVQE